MEGGGGFLADRGTGPAGDPLLRQAPGELRLGIRRRPRMGQVPKVPSTRGAAVLICLSTFSTVPPFSSESERI
jgi:hypothetical protein